MPDNVRLLSSWGRFPRVGRGLAITCRRAQAPSRKVSCPSALAILRLVTSYTVTASSLVGRSTVIRATFSFADDSQEEHLSDGQISAWVTGCLRNPSCTTVENNPGYVKTLGLV